MGVFLICRTILNKKYLLLNQIQHKLILFLILKLRSKLPKFYKNVYCFPLNLSHNNNINDYETER